MVCQNYWLQSSGMLKPLAPCVGMPESLTPREVTSIIGKVRFLTTGESLTPDWLILSVPWGGVPELLAPCWQKSTFKWRLRIGEHVCVASTAQELHIEDHLRPQVSCNYQLPIVVCQNYFLPIRRFAAATNPHGGISEMLAPKDVTTIESEGRFLTSGEYPPPVVFTASPDWLILSAPRGGMPDLLAPSSNVYLWSTE
jgi:hypothetical protein